MQAWSWSALTVFETCPHKYFKEKIEKSVKDRPNTATDWGTQVHKALHKRIIAGAKLPLEMTHLEKYAKSIEAAPGDVYTEQQLAITSDFSPTGWFDRDVWLRAIVDVAKVNGNNAVMLDYKTGKMKDDFGQLDVTAAVFFSYFPDVETLSAGFLWIADKQITQRTYFRSHVVELRAQVIERQRALQEAVKTNTFPPRPNGLCKKYCAVKTCPHNGANVQ